MHVHLRIVDGRPNPSSRGHVAHKVNVVGLEYLVASGEARESGIRVSVKGTTHTREPDDSGGPAKNNSEATRNRT